MKLKGIRFKDWVGETELRDIGIYPITRARLLDNPFPFFGFFDEFKVTKQKIFRFKDQRLPEILWVNANMVEVIEG